MKASHKFIFAYRYLMLSSVNILVNMNLGMKTLIILVYLFDFHFRAQNCFNKHFNTHFDYLKQTSHCSDQKYNIILLRSQIAPKHIWSERIKS